MASMNEQLRELQGPLIPPKSLVPENDDCLEEEDDDCLVEGEEEPVFVDAAELCSGGLRAGSLPGRLRGEEAGRRGWLGGECRTALRCDPGPGQAPGAVRRLPLGRPGCAAQLRIKLY